MQILSSAHARNYKTSSIVALYHMMTAQQLDTDTVYQLYCRSLKFIKISWITLYLYLMQITVAIRHA